MNYTKNYRLPQWVDEDRIMRQDFNNAMANIENGLTENRAAHDGTNPRLFRMAYNSWQHLFVLPEIPRQDGAFRQGFAKGENPLDTVVSGKPETRNAVNGMVQLSDRLWTANWDTALNAKDFYTTFQVLRVMSSSSGSDTCSFTFTPPAPGYLYNVVLYGDYSGNWSSTSQGPLNFGDCTVRIYNDLRSELLQESPGSLGFIGNGGHGYYKVPFEFYLAAGTRYRIEVQIKKLDINVELSINTSPEGDAALDIYGRKQESVSFTRRFQEAEGGQGGLVLARYDTRGAEGGVSVDWMGETLEPYAVRTVNYRGLEVREAEFRLEKAVSSDSAVTLTIRCGKDGEFDLFDWGAVLI